MRATIYNHLMSTTLLVVQILNGLQLGVLLFLIAAGLTLVFGVMDFINLAHGVQYMLGAYLAVAFYALTGSFLAALVLALAAALVFGLLLEFVVFRQLYDRDHLDQVMATFGIILLAFAGVALDIRDRRHAELRGLANAAVEGLLVCEGDLTDRLLPSHAPLPPHDRA